MRGVCAGWGVEGDRGGKGEQGVGGIHGLKHHARMKLFCSTPLCALLNLPSLMHGQEALLLALPPHALTRPPSSFHAGCRAALLGYLPRRQHHGPGNPDPPPHAPITRLHTLLMQGAALLFWDIFPDGNTTDRAALHASCPTTKGFKWTATRWIHTVPYAQQQWSAPRGA